MTRYSAIFFICLLLPSLCFPVEYAKQSPEEESSLRRAEIVFFLSSPFTMLFSTILIGGVYSQATGSDFTPLLWPQEVWLGIGAATIISSSVIAYYDYVELNKEKSASRLNIKFSHQF